VRLTHARSSLPADGRDYRQHVDGLLLDDGLVPCPDQGLMADEVQCGSPRLFNLWSTTIDAAVLSKWVREDVGCVSSVVPLGMHGRREVSLIVCH